MPQIFKRIGRHPRIEPVVAHALRSAAARPSLPFFLGELRGSGTRSYRVRGQRIAFSIEHGSTDAATFDQAFRQRVYDPPEMVDEALKSLGRPPVILDLGGNIGMFSLWAANRWPGAHVTAVEPLPRNAALLRRNASLVATGVITVLEAAATTDDGTVSFGGGDFTNGRVLDDTEASSVSVPSRDVFPLIADVDLLKLDIEGGEWPILADPRFIDQSAMIVMLEHHPMGAPAGASPEHAAESFLENAGYSVTRTVTEFAGAGIVWGVRPTRSLEGGS